MLQAIMQKSRESQKSIVRVAIDNNYSLLKFLNGRLHFGAGSDNLFSVVVVLLFNHSFQLFQEQSGGSSAEADGISFSFHILPKEACYGSYL